MSRLEERAIDTQDDRGCGKEIKTNKEEYKQLTIAWINMRQRCYNKNHPKYPDWGGRGITVCATWKNNKYCFVVWALLNGFQLGLTLDRINVNGNYSPKNCRWIAQEEQLRNQRKNVYLTHNGMTLTAAEWARKYGENRGEVARQIRQGMSFEEIFNTERRYDQ